MMKTAAIATATFLVGTFIGVKWTAVQFDRLITGWMVENTPEDQITRMPRR